MKTQTYTSNGITQFILGLALFNRMNATLLHSQFVVAITVFAMLMPWAMAFGDLARVTSVAGLYVALGAMMMYALFDTSKQVVMGPEATCAIMTAAVAPLAGSDMETLPRIDLIVRVHLKPVGRIITNVPLSLYRVLKIDKVVQ